ncbi:MAG: RNA polymerase sigma factor [Candidatus Bipolaricaulota bacterium]|nr:MAG: RNA polymerase sigma factor [Candidatus Bipolaricaulota bacterium]
MENIGEPAAATVADLFEASRESLFRYAVSLCKTIDRADDLVQEAFLRALRHASTLDRMNPYQRDAWLKRTLRNRFFDEERKRRRTSAAVLEMIRQARRPSGTAEITELNDILDRVPERFRVVLERRYRLGMNSREIGEELGIPAATVRSLLHQAILWLRGEMTRSVR